MKNLGERGWYLAAFIGLFFVELWIGVFVRDAFVRPYLGDVLVTALLYYLVRVFIPKGCKGLPLYIFIFAAAVEFLQYFHIADLLGLGDNRIARIVFGSTFDWSDLACYAVGCAAAWALENLAARRRG